ncbi:hypothetical protein [Micropruina sp.]|uniref:NUDIX hydrolase n=1 Tax=Micropruina sp. TaxID=2737536 RepID=UPI00260B8274|nr:hypothetical protein [Micropruina sp.]
MTSEPITAEVLAVIVALVDGEPCVLTLPDAPRLPAGPVLPGHRSLQTAVRAWVEEQTGLRIGYLEQLYTFADRDREGGGRRTISVSYLGLVRGLRARSGQWRRWYGLFPWEDRRTDDALLHEVVAPALRDWAKTGDRARKQRCAITFGLDGRPWHPDLALQRYEVLYEAGLVAESPAQWRRDDLVPGERLDGDHRRIVATGVARLRATIQYRPVVFELMPSQFTLGQLQACVEALAGRVVHTQNFRRLVEQQQLVEETGGRAGTGGRPARLYRFRREVLQERQAAGTKLPAPRSR